MNNKILLPKPYDLLSYDMIFIVLKVNSILIEKHKEIITYDTQKCKYFINGKLIIKQRIDKKHEAVIKYPRYRTISIIPSSLVRVYENTKSEEKQESMILSIPYSEIEYLIAPFDNLDWVK